MRRLFSHDINIFVVLYKEEKCEKIGQYSVTNISGNA